MYVYRIDELLQPGGGPIRTITVPVDALRGVVTEHHRASHATERRTFVFRNAFHGNGTTNDTVRGRATRVFLALDVATDTFVVVKDWWREDGLKSEGDVYRKLDTVLDEAQWVHLPTTIYAGGVLSEEEADVQETKTPRYLGRRARKYTHERMIQEVAYHIRHVRTPRELVRAVRDGVSGKHY